MQIDWFTFVAQIVNFLILIWLLKRFLYRPVIDAMDRRAASIAAEAEAAEKSRADAERDAASYRSMTESLERERQERLQSATREAAKQRSDLIEQAKKEVAGLKAEWDDALKREQSSYLDDLKQRTRAEVLEIARRVLRDLADADVEQRVVGVFIDRLSHLDDAAVDELRRAVDASGDDMEVRSAFELAEEARGRITDAISDRVGRHTTPEFSVDPSIGLGIELRAGGWRLAWSTEHYLDTLEAVFHEGAPGSAAASASPATPDGVEQSA